MNSSKFSNSDFLIRENISLMVEDGHYQECIKYLNDLHNIGRINDIELEYYTKYANKFKG